MVAACVRHGWHEYRAGSRWWVLPFVLVPRALFQAAFLVLLGGMVAGQAGMTYAFIGVTAYAMTLPALHHAALDFNRERWEGTLVHLDFARLPAAVAHLVKSWPHALEGVGFALLLALVLGPAFGQWELAAGLISLPYLYLPMVVSILAFGTALQVVAPKRQELLVLNVATICLLVLTGAVVPTTNLPSVAQAIHYLLPLTHGIQALRNGVAGEPVAGHLVNELLVGALWLLAALILHRLHSSLQRRTGRGDLH